MLGGLPMLRSQRISHQCHTCIPCSDIESASLNCGDGDSLVLVLRAGALLPGGTVVLKTWPRRVGRLFSGGDVHIPLHGLIYQPKRLRTTPRGNLERARREPADELDESDRMASFRSDHSE